MFAKVVTSLLVVLVAVDCAPSPVSYTSMCVPMQWEGISFGTIAQVHKGTTTVLDLVGTVSSNYTQNSVASVQTVSSNGTQLAVVKTLLIDESIYIIDTARQMCRKIAKPISPLPLRFCIPSDLVKYVGSWTIGEQTTDTYRAEVPEARTTITLLRDSFTPVSQVTELRLGEIAQMQAIQYGNITLGIRDPSVFDVPSYCPEEPTIAPTTPSPVSSTTTPIVPATAIHFTTSF